MTIQEVDEKLSSIATFEHKLELLQDEYPCLYFLVCDILGIDTREYIKFCRGFENDENLFIYYVFACIKLDADELRAQQKIK